MARGLRSKAAPAVFVAFALLLAILGTARPVHAAGSIANTALILGTSVVGSPSLEETEAKAAGFTTVKVVTATEWLAMTAADFAKWQVIIIGDPACGGLAGFAAAQTNATVWQPVVMSSRGNKVLIGTDPTFHNGGTHRGDLLEKGGIGFAGAILGATGAYVDTSCSYSDSAGVSAPPGTPVPIMDGLSTHGAKGFTAGGAPCAGSISIVASTGPTAGLKDADLSNWFCSVHAFFDKFPSDWTVLALATDPSVPKVVSAKDIETGKLVTGSPYILLAGEGIISTSNITLTPATATNPVGSSHTVTATVCGASSLTVAPCPAGTSPLSGLTVTFAINSGPNVGASGTCVPVTCMTNASGQVTFTYTDSGGAGTDGISARVTVGGALQTATATKIWKTVEFPITAAPGKPVSATEGKSFTAAVATFTDPDPAATKAEYSATIAWGDATTSAGTISGGGTGTGTQSFTVTGTHTYAEEGSYTITVVITDIDTPSNSAKVSTTATVGDAALTAKPACMPTSTVLYQGLTATFTDAASPFGTLSDFSAVISWGDGTSSAGTVSGPNGGPYAVSGTHTYSTLGPHTITTVIKDVGGSTATTSCTSIEFAFPAGGDFVVGDNSATGSVLFWGAQWAKQNVLSGGDAPRSFKGFEDSVADPTCGSKWTTDPGNSSGPPATIPTFMAVIVSSSISKFGSTIAGDTVHMVVVQTDPGYEPNPGHAGTGTVVAVIC